ncbi:MAG: hypothetical protein K0U36_04360 [Alphaproteobacteria bacterium]|nr:hypothetical protein [Alphaproteobacteria bacterium]
MITSQNHGFAVVDVTQTILDADIDADDDADLDANIDADNALGAGDDSRGDDSRGDDSPDDVSRGVVTHVSLFDGSVEGFARTDRPVAAVQYHPEASPGPHDARPFFARFKQAMVSHRAQRSAR